MVKPIAVDIVHLDFFALDDYGADVFDNGVIHEIYLFLLIFLDISDMSQWFYIQYVS